MRTKDLLREEVDTQIEQLKTEKLGTEEYDKTVNGICKMVDKLNEMDKLELEKRKIDIEETNSSIEWERTKSENTDRKVKNILTGVGLGLTAAGGIAMFIFEEKGTIVVSQAGRKFVDRLFKSKI